MSSTGDKTNNQGNNPKPFYKSYKFWMLVVAVAYSVAAIALWHQTQQATEATRLSADAQVATVRAWIWPVNWQWHPVPDSYPSAQSNWAPITYVATNVGHTPAINVSVMAREQYVYRPMNAPLPQMDTCPDVRPPENPESRDIQIILPGQGPNMAPTLTPTADQYDALVKGHATLILHGCIYYNIVSSEEFGVSEFCMEWLSTSIIAICHSNNSMK